MGVYTIYDNKGEKMKTLNIDIETYSSVPLSKAGVYKYAESEDFKVLLFAYSVDREEVKVVDLENGEKIPIEVLNALKDDKVTKWAFNANFERICLSKFLKEKLNPISWRCTMVWSAYLGLPLSLEGVGLILGLDKQKLKDGKELIKYFCVPNRKGERNRASLEMEKWSQFKNYNKRDVEVEMLISEKLKRFPVPDFIWKEYELDQIINDRGIMFDRILALNAVEIDEKNKEKIMKKLISITNIENPNSVIQMREWLLKKGVETDTLDKKKVKELIEVVDEDTREVLELRQQLTKSSVKKYTAMISAACKDDRCRGMFQFLGANRTGRYAGRIVQLQNLPRNSMSDLKNARELVKEKNIEGLELLYDISDTLSQLIRTAFIPKKGYKFIVADFSSIEARVLAWLAGETWREDLFEKGGDIYCMSASQMFGVPVEKHGINAHLRQKGKIAELACGYGGSIGALKAMGALDMGIKEYELQDIVSAWREANYNIVNFWWDIDREIKRAIKEKIETNIRGLRFNYKSGILFITLPSGRKLSYIKPKIGINQFGGESVTYEGLGVAKKWERIESYGPKFVENIVQAISRDLLMFAIFNLKEFRIVAHVHDEVILEVEDDVKVEHICKIMSKTPPWAKELRLNADGYEYEFYMKD